MLDMAGVNYEYNALGRAAAPLAGAAHCGSLLRRLFMPHGSRRITIDFDTVSGVSVRTSTPSTDGVSANGAMAKSASTVLAEPKIEPTEAAITADEASTAAQSPPPLTTSNSDACLLM